MNSEWALICILVLGLANVRTVSTSYSPLSFLLRYTRIPEGEKTVMIWVQNPTLFYIETQSQFLHNIITHWIFRECNSHVNQGNIDSTLYCSEVYSELSALQKVTGVDTAPTFEPLTLGPVPFVVFILSTDLQVSHCLLVQSVPSIHILKCVILLELVFLLFLLYI